MLLRTLLLEYMAVLPMQFSATVTPAISPRTRMICNSVAIISIHRFKQLKEQYRAELSGRDQDIERMQIRYRALLAIMEVKEIDST